MRRTILCAGLVMVLFTLVQAYQISRAEKSGLIDLPIQGETHQKRYVLRHPEDPKQWNGRLLIAAHGGTGGERLDIEGRVVGTDETSLDDIVGDYAVDKGYAYASVDRDGFGATLDGLRLTYAFTERMEEELRKSLGRSATHTYLVGLSMGGGIARFAAEDELRLYDGVLIIAGAAGDIPTRLERQAESAVLWPKVDPETHPDLTEGDDRIRAYAEAVRTPVAARPFWPFIGAGASLAGLRRSLEGYGLSTISGLSDEELSRFRFVEYSDDRSFRDAVEEANTTGRPAVPTIEVVGTYDDFVRREILAYKKKVDAASANDRHRLYQVEGVWHISGDDDAMQSFAYIAKRRNLGEGIQAAMLGAGSYIQTVREALNHLDLWVTKKALPPRDQMVQQGKHLSLRR